MEPLNLLEQLSGVRLRRKGASAPECCTMTVGNMESAALFNAGKKGRGLRATKELSAGEVVFAEPSFSAVVFDRSPDSHDTSNEKAVMVSCELEHDIPLDSVFKSKEAILKGS
ncbi:histone-lysine N-methyltransferase Smyd1-like isoform X1 [Lates japonicus]|uniref:Histone-lysine N-methyltransferase Smyd1-like isoform X1 n=1 Tax=Lates japonicus TaxID=270547 RepID=A0AAD3NPB8_LATJO|nr:histone-lysine N-methyltransferase Smyd1-like isoform X1 [Lates japonicus]